VSTTASGDYVNSTTDLCDVCAHSAAVGYHHAITYRRANRGWTDTEILDALAQEWTETVASCQQRHGRRAL
jgi:hypothetical protein